VLCVALDYAIGAKVNPITTRWRMYTCIYDSKASRRESGVTLGLSLRLPSPKTSRRAVKSVASVQICAGSVKGAVKGRWHPFIFRIREDL
jgi:hypothetical protein